MHAISDRVPSLPLTPAPLRAWRWLRAGVHIALALFLAGVVFPLAKTEQRAHILQWWSAKLLHILNIRLRISGRRLPEHARNTIVTSNHISWLDIFVINAAHPARFVAKSEIRGWPVVGWLCHAAGTIFIQRGKRSDTARIAAVMHDALQEGDTLGLFPEGTTTLGDHLLKFNSSLFEPAIANKVHLAPVAIRYGDANGGLCEAAAFIGETSFFESMGQIIGQRTMTVQLMFAPHIDAAGLTRRELAAQAEVAVATQLGVALPKTRQRFDAGAASTHATAHKP